MIQEAAEAYSYVNDLTFCLAAVAGQVLHMIKKWAEGYTSFRLSCKRAISAIIGNIAYVAGFVASGQLVDMHFGALIAFGLTSGLAANSLINKAERPAWTEEEREERTK